MAEQGEGFMEPCKDTLKRKRPQPQNLPQPKRSIRLLEISQRTNSVPLMPRKPNKKSTKSSAQSLFYLGGNDNEERGYESPDDKKIVAINISMPLLGGTSSDGWSKEQDVALHNAYCTLKVSATFWKDVAKLVPGKSSKECFDRFYSAYPTPRFSRSQSKLDGKIRRSPKRPLNLHSLLKATGSTGRRFHCNRQKILQAHRTVRWLLGKHKTADKGYETDLFSSVGVESADSSVQTSLLLTEKRQEEKLGPKMQKSQPAT
ncbi:hypothetical protein SUGI_0224260 [Cryptomeria japonica]|uniref:uncharacterized protein LOC131048580 isoform X2 n=1 Tax=Cryptomeria japonica TaxID=3369 RepID=UPI002408DE03|nr:uncharacterized protein LOC131048580 isoform X2 [Cryptomeria japonica]GLJ14030.1 hypothetical protein SUGI_0224260 [Cryptomeria japonica]